MITENSPGSTAFPPQFDNRNAYNGTAEPLLIKRSQTSHRASGTMPFSDGMGQPPWRTCVTHYMNIVEARLA